MRLVIQRVNHAQVVVEETVTGAIEQGYLVLLGVADGDTCDMVERYVQKLAKLRIFPDENGKTNLSIKDVGGKVLVVSQFTLYADCKKGNRPSFTKAASPELAQELYEYFLKCVRDTFGEVQHGIFGAHMKILLENDGPFTIIWDSSEW
ncbi:MAG: D-aminoacyl-tRNA deacylase [Lachnospiraceae bacterium]